jgi:crotonobetainyl-CoA:carnitine CoA-transferase CaiB-like acyl-CoA transferase
MSQGPQHAGESDGDNDGTRGNWTEGTGPLAGVRVLEIALLAPDSVGMHLADLGAEVVKIEDPARPDYVRTTGGPHIDGLSLLHWHWNRGKRSLGLDLRSPDGQAVFAELIAVSDVVIEGLRYGALARLGFATDRLFSLNPRLVIASVSGYGSTGPYATAPSHGVAFDAYAGLVPPVAGPDEFVSLGLGATDIGTHAGGLYGALGVVSALLQARASGRGSVVEIAQADAAAGWAFGRVESAKARRDGRLAPRPPGGPSSDLDMSEAVRYQYYATIDGHLLVMASERAFWRNLCEGVDRVDLYERWPGAEVAEHARGNRELRRELAAIFATRTTAAWVEFGIAHNVPIAPVHWPDGPVDDPQFVARTHWSTPTAGPATIATPLRFSDGLPSPATAPTPGEHTDAVLQSALGYGDERLAELRSARAIG